MYNIGVSSKIDKTQISICSTAIVNNHFTLDFYNVYKRYQEELRMIDATILEPIESEENCIAHLDVTANYTDNVIYYGQNKIGIISYQRVNWLNDDKRPILYIDHFYILPEFRHTGLAQAAIRVLFENNPQYIYFFYVLEANDNAINFWNSVLKENGLVKIKDDRCHIDDEDEKSKGMLKVIAGKRYHGQN